MHGSILPHNIFLIAFVLHNLTPSQAGPLFFPSIVDLDSTVKYLHSPKFNLAMKSFRQELSKYVRSVFVDLSSNVASKFKGLYSTLDTYPGSESLTGTFFFRKRSRMQLAIPSLRSKSELETKPTPEENLPSTNNSSKFDVVHAINPTDKVLNELDPTAIVRKNQNKVKMKNATRRKKPRYRGRLTRLNSLNRQKPNDPMKIAFLGHSDLKASGDYMNNSIVYPRVTNTEKDNSEPRISTNSYTSISETTQTKNLTHQNERKPADMLPGTMKQSNRKENTNVNQSTFIVGHYRKFSGIDHTRTTTFAPKASGTTFHSSSYTNGLLLNTTSVGIDTRGEINKTLKIVTSFSDFKSRFPGPYRSSEQSTLEKNSSIIQKQPLLPAPKKNGENITLKHTAELNASKPILMTEEERKLLFRKSKRRAVTKGKTSLHRRKHNVSDAKSEVFQPSLNPILTVLQQNSTLRQISGMKNSSLSITKFLPFIESKEAKATEANLKGNSSERLRKKEEKKSLAYQVIPKSGVMDDITNSLEINGSQNITKNPPKFPEFELEALENFKFGQKFDANGTSNNQVEALKFDGPSTLPSARNHTNRKELNTTEALASTDITDEKNVNHRASSVAILYKRADGNHIVKRSSLPSTMQPTMLEEIVTQSTELFESTATNENYKFGRHVILRNGSKADKLYHDHSSREVSIHKDETISPVTTRPHKVMIKSRIKKRAAYDAMMNMIASKWAKMNNEEAEFEEPVTDDVQYEDHLQSNVKDPTKLPTTKRISKADHERFQIETQDFLEPIKISKHYESSLPHDINGKISNLCLSFEAMNRKKTTEVPLSNQSATENDEISTSSVAAPPKLKRSFSENNNRTNKAVKRKRRRKSNKLKTVTVPLGSASETDQLLDIAIEQFEDKLKSIIQSSWPRKNFRDPAQKSEDFPGGNGHSSSSLAQNDWHNYVISTCKQTLDQIRKQHTSVIQDLDTKSEDPEEEFTSAGIRATDMAGTSAIPLPVRRFDHLMQTTPHNSVTKKTPIKVQKINTDRNTASYLLQIDDLREPFSNKQRHLESSSNPGIDVIESGKSLEKERFCSPPCVSVTGSMKTSGESDEEKVILIGTFRTTTSSTTTEKYLQPSEPQYPRLQFPASAPTGMPETLVGHEESEASILGAPNNNENSDENKSERDYQPSLEKPISQSYFYTTWEPNNKNPISGHATHRPLAKDNIMRLDRKLENFFAAAGDAAVSRSQNPENLRRSIENFKKIARLNRELLKNIDADDSFSIAEFNPESLGLPPLLNEPTEGTMDDTKGENQEDETETQLPTQSSDDVTQSSMTSLSATPKDGHMNGEFTESNKFIDRGREQSFREVNVPHKCLKTSKSPPMRLFTRSDTYDYSKQVMLSTIDRLASPRTFFTQGRDELETTLFNQNLRQGNERISSHINKPEPFGQNHNYRDSYSPESFRHAEQSTEEDELALPVQDPRYTEDDQNQKSAPQVQFEKPVIVLQPYVQDSVNPIQRYDIIPIVGETLESYYGESSTEAAVDENNGPFFITEFHEPYLSSATEEMVSESDNPPTIKSEMDSSSVKVKPNVSVPQPRYKTTLSDGRFTSTKMTTRQEMSAPAVTPIHQPLRLQLGQHVESNAHTRRKDAIAHRISHLHITGKPRVSYSASRADERQPLGTKYHEEESHHHKTGNTEYHDESLTTQGSYREENPLEESQSFSTPKVQRSEAVGIQKQEISSIEPPSVESNFRPKYKRPLNRTSLRKRHRARKSRTRVGASDSEHDNRTSGINHMSSTEHFFEKFQSSSENSIGLSTEKSSINESMDEWQPEKGRSEEASKTESHVEETVPRLFPLNESRGKGIRFYNRGNHPLSQLYGKEYATSRYFSSTSRPQFLSSSASIPELTTVTDTKIRPNKRVQQTNLSASDGHHKMRPKKRRYNSKRRKTTTAAAQNADEEDSTVNSSF